MYDQRQDARINLVQIDMAALRSALNDTVGKHQHQRRHEGDPRCVGRDLGCRHLERRCLRRSQIRDQQRRARQRQGLLGEQPDPNGQFGIRSHRRHQRPRIHPRQFQRRRRQPHRRDQRHDARRWQDKRRRCSRQRPDPGSHRGGRDHHPVSRLLRGRWGEWQRRRRDQCLNRQRLHQSGQREKQCERLGRGRRRLYHRHSRHHWVILQRRRAQPSLLPRKLGHQLGRHPRFPRFALQKQSRQRALGLSLLQRAEAGMGFRQDV